jgi:very-short-patch-repair endonuclease
VLPGDEVTVVERIPVTSVPRTLFDLAAVSSVENVEFAMREAEYLRLYDELSLSDLLARYPGRRGSRTIKVCLARRAEHGGRTRSRLEEVFVPFLRRHRLPLPRLNAWIELGGSWKQVDCLWAGERVVVELDGFAGHGTHIAFRQDRARDRRLRVAGYDVVRIAWAQLEEEPEAIAADLRTLLKCGSNIQTSVIAYSDR